MTRITPGVVFERTFELYDFLCLGHFPVSARRRALAAPSPSPETRFDRRLSKILLHATEVFYEKGYAGASMRDLSRASGMSLSGLYYYFESKEKLLYLIQKETFTLSWSGCVSVWTLVSDPGAAHSHFHSQSSGIFSRQSQGHEGAFARGLTRSRTVSARRSPPSSASTIGYVCGLLDDFRRERRLEGSSRLAVLSLFGMMNWIYTWYNPRVDADAEEIAGRDGRHFSSWRSAGAVPRRKSRKKKSVN